MNLFTLPPGVRAARRLILVLLCLGAVAASARAGDAPTITSFSPASGPVGSTVVIEGSGFVMLESLTFGGNVAASGSFTSTQITATVPGGAQTGPIEVQTANGTASTATNFIVGDAVLPTVTVAATTPTVKTGSVNPGEFTLTFSSMTTSKTNVDYTLSGTAVNGTDYTLLSGEVRVKAGKTTKTIDIVPMGDLGGAAKKTVKLTLGQGTGYTVGSDDTATVKIKASK